MRSKDQDKMRAIQECIERVYFSTGSAPTEREIAEMVSMHPVTVHNYLSDMAERQMIYRTGGFRGIETPRMRKMRLQTEVPIIGQIACGSPIFAEENIEGYLSVSSTFLGEGTYFALRAVGDSMVGAGIDAGDLVIVRQQESANEGDIVVALCDDSEATLKRYFVDRRRHKIRLHPENKDMGDMYFDSIIIQGVAVKVVKDLSSSKCARK